jgi:hypothetical protein
MLSNVLLSESIQCVIKLNVVAPLIEHPAPILISENNKLTTVKIKQSGAWTVKLFTVAIVAVSLTG